MGATQSSASGTVVNCGYDFPWHMVSRNADIGMGTSSLMVAQRVSVGACATPAGAAMLTHGAALGRRQAWGRR